MRRLLAPGAAALLLAGCGGDPPAPSATATATTTAPVERRSLVARDSLAGTLGYADRGTLAAGAAGTLTRLRAEGARVERGAWLYELDGKHTGWLLYGRRPAWRDFTPSMTDGADVRQLEANLAGLGYAPGVVDGDWTSDTTAAVKRFQDARGLTEDGSLGRGELLFRSGPVRIGEAKTAIGDGVQPGKPLSDIASTRREVAVDLDADRQELARRGAAVTVDLPTGETAQGRVADVASVATGGDERNPATVAVRINLRGKVARRSGLDQAPVDVGFERERAKDALTVPVTALLAQAGGGYVVEVSEGGHVRRVSVRPGLFADGLVTVEGELAEGDLVVVPA